MEKYLKQRTVIRLCFKLWKSATETFQILNYAYDKSVISRVTVLWWYDQFSSGRESFKNEQRNRSLSITKTDENIARVTAVLSIHKSVGCRLVAKG